MLFLSSRRASESLHPNSIIELIRVCLAVRPNANRAELQHTKPGCMYQPGAVEVAVTSSQGSAIEPSRTRQFGSQA